MTNLPLSPSTAAQELLRRRTARTRLLDFTTYTNPAYEVNWHHAVLCTYLDQLIAGQTTRLMVFMPPRHGKSELVSRRLPAFILGRDPNASIIACSYSADLASRMNRDVQRIIDDEPYQRLFPHTTLNSSNVRTTGTYLRNSDIFEVVGHRGFYRSTGVGGGITGMGCQFAIIDDPVKNREEANSARIRDAHWDWYTSTLYTRLETGGAVLVTLTRWHEDDLAGRLLQQMEADRTADQWTIVKFPALLDEPPHGDDPRQAGEALWPTKYGLDILARIRAQSIRDWEALFQQRPRPLDGSLFKRSWFEIVPAAPADARRVRYWDMAATEGDGDYTVGVRMARVDPGLWYVEDVVRGQWSSGRRNAVIRQTAALDGPDVTIWGEQEPGSSGKESAEAFIRMLEGYPVYVERVSGDKQTRADPFAAQCQAGNVKLVAGDWNRDYLNELCGFPTGVNDDQVDGSSGAFNKLVDSGALLLW